MCANCSQLYAAHNKTAVCKTRAVFPACVFGFQHTIQPDRTIRDKKIRQQTFGVLSSGRLSLGALNHNYLNPDSSVVLVEPAAPRGRVNRQWMNVSAQWTGMMCIQVVAFLGKFG